MSRPRKYPNQHGERAAIAAAFKEFQKRHGMRTVTIREQVANSAKKANHEKQS